MRDGTMWNRASDAHDRLLSPMEPKPERPDPSLALMRVPGKRPRRRRGALGLIDALNAPDNNAKAHLVRSYQDAAKSALIADVGHACEACSGMMPDPSMMHMHHVVPVSRGGDNSPSNTVLLCPNCHAIAHWMDRTYDRRPADRHELLAAFSKRTQERASA